MDVICADAEGYVPYCVVDTLYVQVQIHVPVVRGKGSLCQEMLTSLHKSGTHVPSDSSGRMYPEVVPR